MTRAARKTERNRSEGPTKTRERENNAVENRTFYTRSWTVFDYQLLIFGMRPLKPKYARAYVVLKILARACVYIYIYILYYKHR